MLSIARERRHATAGKQDADGGFILLETILAIGLITVIMTALTMFFLNATDSSAASRNRENAAVIASNTIDQIRLMNATDTYGGRSAASVATQWTSAPSQVGPISAWPTAPSTSWLAKMYPAFDNSGVTPKLPMTQTAQTLNGVAFTPTNYLGFCAIPVASSDGTDCLKLCPPTAQQDARFGVCTNGYAATVEVANYLRVVVAVTWPDADCVAGKCAYLTSTLLSTDTDPNFLLNQSPPDPPKIACTNTIQTAAVSDAVAITPCALTSTNVINPITYQATSTCITSTPCTALGTPPGGLTINADTGQISGTVTDPYPSTTAQSTKTIVKYTVTVTATDGFGRTTQDTFEYDIYPDIIISDPGAQPEVVGTAIATTTLTVNGNTNNGGTGGYVWTVPATGSSALPPGLTMSMTTGTPTTAVITGTPTTPGIYASVITVRDSSGRTRTRTINWTVYAVPTVGAATATLYMPAWQAAEPLAYTCDVKSSCKFTLNAGAPSWLGLSTSSSATSGTTSVTVSGSTGGGSGTIYLVGTGDNSGTTFPIKVTPSDLTAPSTGVTPAAATWSWGLNDLTVARNAAITTQALRYTCSAACTVTLAGLKGVTAMPAPTGTGNTGWLSSAATGGTTTNSLSLPAGSGTFYVRGTMPSTAATGTYVVTTTIKMTATPNTQLSIDTSNWTVS